MPIQGESNLKNPRNQQYNPKTKPSKTKTQELTKNNKETTIDFITDNPTNTNTSNCNPIDFITDKQNQQQQVPVQNQRQQAPQNQAVNELQSCSRSNLPASIQIAEQVAQIEGKTEDNSQTELAMAAAVSEIKAIDPLSLEEAMG